MGVLLVVIFLLVFIFAILPEYLPGISRKVVDLTVEEDEEEKKHRQELKELREELQNISMMDEFPKYARTERKLLKLKEEVAKLNKSKTEVFLKMKLGVNVAYHALQVFMMLGLMWTYRYEPLLQLPHEWVWPMQFFISFPSRIPGAIGITCWLIVCRSVVRKAVNLIKR